MPAATNCGSRSGWRPPTGARPNGRSSGGPTASTGWSSPALGASPPSRPSPTRPCSPDCPPRPAETSCRPTYMPQASPTRARSPVPATGSRCSAETDRWRSPAGRTTASRPSATCSATGPWSTAACPATPWARSRAPPTACPPGRASPTAGCRATSSGIGPTRDSGSRRSTRRPGRSNSSRPTRPTAAASGSMPSTCSANSTGPASGASIASGGCSPSGCLPAPTPSQ